MSDQYMEDKQAAIEMYIRRDLNHLYSLLEAWDGDGHEEMAEDMTGYIASWKATLEGDVGSVDQTRHMEACG